VSQLQQQAYPTGARPEIPLNQGTGAPYPILFDEFLDLAAGDPGLSQRAEIAWADAGPLVLKGMAMCILLTPILDADMSQAVLGNSNANLYLEAYGVAVADAGASGIAGLNAQSIPRYDVKVPNGQ